jgi:hypothetical protein
MILHISIQAIGLLALSSIAIAGRFVRREKLDTNASFAGYTIEPMRYTGAEGTFYGTIEVFRVNHS